MMMWIWFGLTVVLLIVELTTSELVAVWFAAAALVLGLIAGFFPALSVLWQIVIFAVLSTALLIVTRPLVRKLMKRGKNKETNLELVLNHKALVVEEINNDREEGAVKINGLVWTARSTDGSVIEKDSLVNVKEINGNKAFVEKIQNGKEEDKQ